MNVSTFTKVNSVFTKRDFSAIVQAPNPRIEIRRLGSTGKLNLIVSLGTDSTDAKSLLSYSYTRSMDDTKSKFSLRVKDTSKYNVFDKVKPFDIVEIYRTPKDKPDYVGILHSKQISASIGSDGKVHKEISLSGNSIISLYSDFNINLSVIGTYATSTDAANFLVKNTYFTVQQDSTGKKSLVPTTIDSVVTSIWNSFKEYAKNLSGVSNVKLLTIMESSEVGMSINCEKLECKYPISTNFYHDGEINFINMIRTIFPVGAYEVFEQPNELIIREKPFYSTKWKKLPTYEVNVNKLIEYDFNQNDNEVYSVFMADIEGLSSIETRQSYKKKSANKNGYIEVTHNLENVQTYGYKLCNVNFQGYVQNPLITKDSNKLLDDMDNLLKEMYENNHKMLNGRIKLADSIYETTPTIGEKLNFRLAIDKDIQTTSFYIIGETHNWSYGSSSTVEYQVTRGAVYGIDGTFEKTSENFSTALENQIYISSR